MKNSFDKKLNCVLLKKQKNRFESFKKFEENINKLENKLVKIIKRPKSQLLIFYNNGQEKFRIKKEEREDSNNYNKDKCDKMNFQFNRYLRTENNFKYYIISLIYIFVILNFVLNLYLFYELFLK